MRQNRENKRKKKKKKVREKHTCTETVISQKRSWKAEMHREREKHRCEQRTPGLDQCKHAGRAGLGERGAEESKRQGSGGSSAEIPLHRSFEAGLSPDKGSKKGRGSKVSFPSDMGGCSGIKGLLFSCLHPARNSGLHPLLSLVHRPQPPTWRGAGYHPSAHL